LVFYSTIIIQQSTMSRFHRKASMSSELSLLVALGIGVVAGLRSLTAPAVVAWAAWLGWLHLEGSHLAFMGSPWAVGIFTLLALFELVADQLPSTPARTTAVGLSARIVTGGLTGACLAVAGGAALWLGAVAGVVGALIGTFGGYQARVGLVRALRVPDFAIAIPEDIIAIGLGLFLASRI
jgi:uncharacterized membrane protein